MVRKIHKTDNGENGDKAGAGGFGSPLSGAIKDSAQQIWLAGLGAFAKAQEEGGKAFEALVKEGLSMQRKSHAVAEERVHEASDRMSSMANDISAKAQGQWDKLENIFEERVAKAMSKLGVPSARDVQALNERVDSLSQQVQRLSAKPPARKAAPAKKSPARKRVA